MSLQSIAATCFSHEGGVECGEGGLESRKLANETL